MKTLIALLFLSAVGHADIDLRHASYIETTSDTPGVSRTYNSRSLYNGLFGYGWCSDLDLRLNITAREIIFDTCRRALPLHFPRSLKNFLTPNAGWVLQQEPDGFLLQSQNGPSFRFNFKGRLVERRLSDGSILRLDYRDGHLKDYRLVSHGLSSTYEITLSPILKKVVSIDSKRTPPVSYTYKNFELIAVKSGNKIIRYTYDDLSNLTEIVEGSKKTIVHYEKGLDRLTEVIDPLGCRETLKYKTVSLHRHYVIQTQIVCGRLVKRRSYDFFYRAGQGALPTLSEIRFLKGGHPVAVHFDEDDKNRAPASETEHERLKTHSLLLEGT